MMERQPLSFLEDSGRELHLLDVGPRQALVPLFPLALPDFLMLLLQRRASRLRFVLESKESVGESSLLTVTASSSLGSSARYLRIQVMTLAVVSRAGTMTPMSEVGSSATMTPMMISDGGGSGGGLWHGVVDHLKLLVTAFQPLAEVNLDPGEYGDRRELRDLERYGEQKNRGTDRESPILSTILIGSKLVIVIDDSRKKSPIITTQIAKLHFWVKLLPNSFPSSLLPRSHFELLNPKILSSEVPTVVTYSPFCLISPFMKVWGILL